MTDTIFRRLSILALGLFFVGSFFMCATPQAHAQTFDNSVESRDIRMVLDPATPGTNEEVEVSLDSLIININRMLITWFVDGELLDSGVGLDTITVTTKGQGELTRVEAYVQVDNETSLRKWIQIAPADLDILWEADTYTPPFYRGKALPTPESHITIIGLPNLRNQGIQQLEQRMVFNWRVNNENVPEASGYGKNPLVIRNDFLRTEERVTLRVQHQDGFSTAESSIVIPIKETKVLLYQDGNGLRKANRLSFEDQVGIRPGEIIAEPYFFSTRPELLNLLTYRWRVNGSAVDPTDPSQSNTLTVQPTGGIASSISVSVENPRKLLQTSSSGQITVLQ